MFNYINKIIKAIKPLHFLLFGVLLVFLTNSQYVSYPDEFVNILGGKAINAGKVPYREFFDHHLPGAWYLSAVFLWFSFDSFVMFRFVWALFAFAVLFFTGRYIQSRNKEAFPFFLGYFVLYPFITVYYWTHLFLADSLAFLFFSSIFWILMVESFEKKTAFKTILWLTVFNFVFLFSSLSFIYIVLIFYLWLFVLLIKNGYANKILLFIGISAAPYIFYALYLLISNSWREFYISNFVYNTKLYMHVPNYTPGRFFNPLKFGLTIIFNFFETYIPLLVRIKEFNLYFPVDLILALGTFLLFLFLIKELPLFAGLFFLVLSFSAPRSNLMKIGEMDYQSGMFIALGMISFFMVLWRYSKTQLSFEPFEMVRKFLVGMLVLYGVFGSLFLIHNTYNKTYLRYTQKMPSVYDHAPTGFFINDIVGEGEYYWIGPYEPHEEFFVKNAKLPGKFPTLLPQFREDEYFSSEFIKQFETNPPKLIMYKHEASIFMTPSMEFGKFFVDWMEDKYVSLETIPGLTILKSPETFNMKTDIYLLKSEQTELLKRLVDKEYISIN